MTKRIPRDYMKCIRETLEEFGVKDWEIDHTRKHPTLFFTLNGFRHTYAVTSTPSDRRSFLNTRADLRRMCRLPPPNYGCRVSL